MAITQDELAELLREIEHQDPIDFGDLPFDEDALRSLVLQDLIEQQAALSAMQADQDDLNLVYMLSTAKLVLENLVLNARLLMLSGGKPDMDALFSRYRRH
ncbi:hypothetical protein ABWL39_19620 [Chitinivorax sp. PXF-14]|uniref:hypothetical protein n=1 Tax=Chitinivorax sp. PXF-14 TaxID=3230488 RepID=UPI0034666F88